MSEKLHWLPINEKNRNKWLKLCPKNKYHVHKPEAIRDLLPSGLRYEYLDKVDSTVVICSGSSDNSATYLMANLNRIDKGYKVDQDPFMLAFMSGQSTPSGCVLLHGDWKNRTCQIPEEVLNEFEKSDIGNCFPVPTLPNKEEGDLSELHNTSHHDAFKSILENIKKEAK